MKPGLQKFLAAIQIVLQLCPPSFLLYVIPTNVVSAKSNNTHPQKDADSTENSVAQIAVQAGTVLGADDASGSAANALVSTATGAASAEVQQWLNQFGTARVSISTDERFTLNDSELDLLLPLYDQKENLLFAQLGGRRHDDRNIVNTGLGYRHFSDSWMWGTNVFYDQQISGNQHKRVGVGAELGWDYIKLSANGYFRVSNWMSSDNYEDYDERVANGFDIRANGYLPAYPQLGANVIYEQYYGDSVGLFGDDEDDRQKNPHAVTLGLNYTPVPLVTLGVNQKFGKGGENDTQLNLAVSWTPGVPLSEQLDPSAVAQRRSLMGGRQDLVDRNNNIVLEYRKQELITLSLPSVLEGEEQSKQSVTAKVKAKHGLDHIEWQAASFLGNGGKITAGSSPEQFVLTLPSWQGSGVNSYTLTGIAWDKNGNASNTSEMKVNVTGIDINTLQSATTVSPGKIAADGVSTATVTVTLKTSSAESATGLASRLSATLTSSPTDSAAVAPDAVVKKPVIGSFRETAPGVYSATLTSGTTADTLTIQPLIDGSVKLASAKLIEEAAVTIPQLTAVDVSATSVTADGATPIVLTAHVTDQYGKALKDSQVNWSADSAQVALSEKSTLTNEQGEAQIQITSDAIVNTVVTAQLEQGNSVTTPTLSFVADIATAKVVTLESEKQQVVANNNDTTRVSALVKDDNNHPLPGVTVNWKANKTDGAKVASSTSVTDGQGIAIWALKSSKVGTITVVADVNGKNAQESSPITFVADSSTQQVSTIVLSKTQALANGSDAITYEALVTDMSGNAIANTTVNWSADNTDVSLSEKQTLTDASGKSRISVTSLKAGEVVIIAQTTESTARRAEKANFSADNSTAKIVAVESDGQTAIADGSDAITVKATVKDANDNLITNADVAWSVSPVTGNLSAQSSKTDASGEAKVQLTTTNVAKYSVTASINNTSDTVSNLSFTADSATAKLDALNADKETGIVADKDKVALTATVLDANNHPVAGVTVNWSSSETNSTFTSLSSVTDASGLATTTFSSLKAGDISVTAALGTVTQTKTLQVIGNAGTATITSVDSDKAQEVADGTTPVTWTAKVTDANDNALNGVTVNWSADNSDVRLSSASSETTESGVATISATSMKSGEVTVSASITTPAVQRKASAVSFTGDLKTAKMSKLVANTDHVAANTTPVIYTATVVDANDNPIEGATVAWTTSMNKLSAQTSDTNVSGEATVKLSGSDFGKPTVTASINGTTLTDASVMFMGTIEETWNIANGAQTSVYKGETIANLNYLGFVVTGTTTGPTELIWTKNYGAYSVLTAPLTDENGVSHTVTFRGQVSNGCTVFEFNNAAGCEYPGNAPKITYDPSWGENATLPPGRYSGVITFNGKDWHSSWALSYTVNTTLTIN